MKRLKSFLEKNRFFGPSQFGFRERSNTCATVTELMNFIYKSLDRKHVKLVSDVFLDCRKAFDTVQHTILLEKLYRAAVRGIVHDFFSSYLSSRSQIVSIDASNSDNLAIESGVVQGSCLGPIFFFIFINDMHELSLNGKLFLYADDASLFYPSSDVNLSCQQMNEDLETLSRYFNSNLLTLNKSKTKYRHLHGLHTHLDQTTDVTIDGEILERVVCFKYLGLMLDEHLTFQNHYSLICDKISPAIAAMHKLRTTLPQEALRLVYFSLVHSHLTQLCGICGLAAATYLKPVQVMQNRALKILFNLPLLTNTLELYREYGKTIIVYRYQHNEF